MNTDREHQPQTTVISLDNIHEGTGADGGLPAVIDTGPMQCIYQPETPAFSGEDPNHGLWTTGDKNHLVDGRGERQLTREDVEEAVRQKNRRNHIIIGVSTLVMAVVFALTIGLAIKYA